MSINPYQAYKRRRLQQLRQEIIVVLFDERFGLQPSRAFYRKKDWRQRMINFVALDIVAELMFSLDRVENSR